MLVPDSFYLLVLPLGYFVAKMGHNPVLLILTIVAFDMMTCTVRVIYAVKYTVLTFRDIFGKILRPVVLVSLGAGLLQWGLSLLNVSNLVLLIISIISNGFFILSFVLVVEKDIRKAIAKK